MNNKTTTPLIRALYSQVNKLIPIKNRTGPKLNELSLIITKKDDPNKNTEKRPETDWGKT